MAIRVNKIPNYDYPGSESTSQANRDGADSSSVTVMILLIPVMPGTGSISFGIIVLPCRNCTPNQRPFPRP